MPHHHHHHDHPHHHRHRAHHRDRILEALDLLLRSGRVTTIPDLLACIRELDEPELSEFVIEFQRSLGSGTSELATAVAALKAHVGVSANGHHTGLLSDCNGKRVGMIFPLPPHVHEEFIDLPDVTIMVAPGHRLPPHLRRRDAISDPRQCRRLLDGFDMILFDAFRDDGVVWVENGVADILDLQLVPQATRLVAHMRPHKEREDVELDLGGRTVTWL